MKTKIVLLGIWVMSLNVCLSAAKPENPWRIEAHSYGGVCLSHIAVQSHGGWVAVSGSVKRSTGYSPYRGLALRVEVLDEQGKVVASKDTHFSPRSIPFNSRSQTRAVFQTSLQAATTQAGTVKVQVVCLPSKMD